jgi:hypothetical protein
MDQLIIFHKPNKKVRSEKKMDHFIPQTKHTIKIQKIEMELFHSSPLLNQTHPREHQESVTATGFI